MLEFLLQVINLFSCNDFFNIKKSYSYKIKFSLIEFIFDTKNLIFGHSLKVGAETLNTR